MRLQKEVAMDPTDTIDRLASGDALMILAVMVVALAIVVVVLYRNNNRMADKNLEMAEKNSELGREMVEDYGKITSANSEILRQAVKTLEEVRHEIRFANGGKS